LHITLRLYATFGAGNRVMRSIDPRPKCGGEKPHKGRRPTELGDRNPGAPNGRGTHTDLLDVVNTVTNRPPWTAGALSLSIYFFHFL
jgi:hypothetical protein